MDPGGVATELAERLQELVPEGFFVNFDGAALWYSAEPGRFPGQQGLYQVGGSGTDFVENFLHHGETVEEAIVGVTIQALDELQDFVDEASHHPWPGSRRPPRPNAAIRGSELHCWYEDCGDIVAACRPIQLADE